MENDYKDTLLMMTTDFKMKADLPQKEPLILKKWQDEEIYAKLLEKNKDRPYYILHDGPPYANGSIHVGHALNKILKDFIVRYKSMKGFLVPYIPGWDTHGLPIESALAQSEKVNRKQLDIASFRKLCRNYALRQVKIQQQQFMRLGGIGDWDHPYLTLDKEYEATQIRVFAKMAEQGLIYKGLKPVYWSPSSESALAEAEIEYHDVKSPSCYLAFKVADGKGILDEGDEIVVWTTTPWTLPANLAVSAHPLFKYVKIEAGSRKFIVGKDLLAKFATALGLESYNVSEEYDGKDLEYVTYHHPLFAGKICPVILGTHVTNDTGTGFVHTAPGHGEDDFIVGKKYNLEPFCPVDEKGYMTEAAGAFKGMFYADANPVILQYLKETRVLLAEEEIIHSYPHDWRTKKPVIFRTTPQWFASIENLKEKMLAAIEDIKWIPDWGEIRLKNMVKDRKEWCISRQRTWGVPIPVFYGEDGFPILDVKVMNHVADIFLKYGSDSWFTFSEKELLPEGYANPHSPNGIFRKETDIMDVWFDSGSSHQGAMVAKGLPYPSDLYLEGDDQYRGWFNSSLSTGIAVEGMSPYKTCLSHGFVLDGAGNKMSKSLHNIINPLDVCNKYGADILRLWVASVEYTADVRISDDILKQNAEAYRKIRNSFRFLLGNLFDYQDECDRVDYAKLCEVDQYMECLLQRYIKKVDRAYSEFDFSEVYRLTLNYLINDLSSFYFDFAKDILYVEDASSSARRSLQTVFYDILNALVRILTPLIPYTVEDVYQNMHGKSKVLSPALLEFPSAKTYSNEDELIDKYTKLLTVRKDVLKVIETARDAKSIGKSLHASLTIKPKPEYKELFKSLKCDLKIVFIVAEVKLTDSALEGIDLPTGTYKVAAMTGDVCKRCWRIGEVVSPEGLCPRCAKVVAKLKEDK